MVVLELPTWTGYAYQLFQESELQKVWQLATVGQMVQFLPETGFTQLGNRSQTGPGDYRLTSSVTGMVVDFSFTPSDASVEILLLDPIGTDLLCVLVAVAKLTLVAMLCRT